MSWRDYLLEHHERFLKDLADFVAIPSVSALPQHKPDIQDAAAWVAARMTEAGIENAKVMPTDGHPIVYGDWLHAGPARPTILVYGHYDVQPADPLDLWDNPPFQAKVVGNRIYGRGASDDKGGMLTPILAVEALLKTAGALPVNLKCLFEGEEEIGSPNVDAFLSANRDLFSADLVLSADGMLWDADTPQIVLGFKGAMALEINVRTARGDLHSGLHGGVMQNPVEALGQLLATLRHPDGKIAVDGFYDDVIELSSAEREAIASVPMDEAAYQETLDIPDFFGEPGYTTRERNWIRPTMELNGIWGGFQGEGIKTVIPSEANAKISCRLVANQDPNEVFRRFEAHFERHTPPGVRLTVKQLPLAADPYLVAASHIGNRIAAEVLTELFDGRPPYQTFVGGTLPISPLFRKYLGADLINFGWSAGDENLHAPNEFLRIRNFQRGPIGYCRAFERLAEVSPGSFT